MTSLNLKDLNKFAKIFYLTIQILHRYTYANKKSMFENYFDVFLWQVVSLSRLLKLSVIVISSYVFSNPIIMRTLQLLTGTTAYIKFLSVSDFQTDSFVNKCSVNGKRVQVARTSM